MKSLEGRKAPDFALYGSNGHTHSLNDYKGRPVVLYFYPKDNTPGCTKEACSFRELITDFKNQAAVVLGVSRDSFVSHGKFIAAFKLPFVLLTDPDASVMKKYGAFGKKMLYGKPVTGTIRSTVVIGPDGKVLKHWKSVKDAEAHPAEVLKFLAQLDGR
jgi:thioredoxin-dependent peroxiredoxin